MLLPIEDFPLAELNLIVHFLLNVSVEVVEVCIHGELIVIPHFNVAPSNLLPVNWHCLCIKVYLPLINQLFRSCLCLNFFYQLSHSLRSIFRMLMEMGR